MRFDLPNCQFSELKMDQNPSIIDFLIHPTPSGFIQRHSNAYYAQFLTGDRRDNFIRLDK